MVNWGTLGKEGKLTQEADSAKLTGCRLFEPPRTKGNFRRCGLFCFLAGTCTSNVSTGAGCRKRCTGGLGTIGADADATPPPTRSLLTLGVCVMANQQFVKDLIDAGIHFGHRTSRWNPKMKPYIYSRRNLIHIIDVRETLKGVIAAKRF